MKERSSDWVSCSLLESVEVCFAHYLVENKIWWDPRHVLCSAKTSVPHIVLPAKQNQRDLLVFIILYEINKHDETLCCPYLQPSYRDSQHMWESP
jgi:hypothetical protein